MIPIGDENAGTVIKPLVNWTIIGICALVFVYELLLPPGQLDAFFMQWAAIPAEITQFRDLHGLITSMFLHGGWAHFIGNMVFLLIFGDNIEDAMGHLSYLLFYLLTGIAAGLTQVFLSASSSIPLIGASGAISGVLGAYFVLLPRARVLTAIFLGFIFFLREIPAIFFLGVYFLFQAWQATFQLSAPPEEGGVAVFAHIGGIVFGLLAVKLFQARAPLRPRY